MEEILKYKKNVVYFILLLLIGFSRNVRSDSGDEYLFILGIPNIVTSINKHYNDKNDGIINDYEFVEMEIQPEKIFNKYSLLDKSELSLPNKIKFKTTVSHLSIFNRNREIYAIFKKLKNGDIEFVSWSFVTKVACFPSKLIEKLNLDDIFEKNDSNLSCDGVD